ncbi:hypothetical protein [Nitrososphaera viennensis]|uniref:Uncharacterized protein n=2 Tax=Nitrososphaera viennensis TaxID=1034015 RepID=A0A060HM67_9ARCH|nr:hypothetical protein [Nitrososphaera viennensis]AIC14671.1 hypothetical protein NVIE_004750 [Nitrososphaera viennensis EN76]UVS69634.1 hypothetical protein NWT39_02325 [Nitrososphaera viennensis]
MKVQKICRKWTILDLSLEAYEVRGSLTADPLPEDAVIVLSIIKKYSGIRGKYLVMETGFDHNRTIDAVKALVLRNIVYVDFTNYPNFRECRFYPK